MARTFRRDPGPLAPGQTFRIDGGDGDQSILSRGIVMRLTACDWFPGRVGGFGEALLFQVENPPFADDYIALTSHVRMRLQDQFAKHGHASTVVHCVRNPMAVRGRGWEDRMGVGMAAVSRIPDVES